MARLLRDRYIGYDDIHGCDLATGEDVRLDALETDRAADELPGLVELLQDGQDGRPRWIVLDVRDRAHAEAVARGAAAAACRHGFVPLQVVLYERLREALARDLDQRTLLLIGGTAHGIAAARMVLLDASARAPRPHVLLTFRTAQSVHGPAVVREARSAYGPLPLGRPTGAMPVSADVFRHVERAARADEFQRSGRHAAAERLLRDVAAALSRREAWVAAAQTLFRLARLLMERGRAGAADKACGDAAALARSGGDEGLALDARIWQALARADAGRLTEAESLCRAVLLSTAPSGGRVAWTRAALGRILCWQGRVEEALNCGIAPEADAALERDAVVAASIAATGVRVLLAAGRVFEAGMAARGLLDRVPETSDPVARVVALTAHLRALAAAGDLHLAGQAFAAAWAASRRCRTPWRAVRARLIWHDALCRAGRMREAQHELARVARMSRIAPPLLRRAIERRVEIASNTGAASRNHTGIASLPEESSAAAALVHLAHDGEDDGQALRRVLERAFHQLTPSRMELISSDAGPVSVLISIGAGVATNLGERVIESGIVIEADASHGAREIGVPVRIGGRLVAAVVCRWPIDRQPPPHSASLLGLVAAVAAPRAEAFLAGLHEKAAASTLVPELIGASAAMAEVRRAIQRAARAPFAVLIEGESGVGKELVARAIHHLSPRRERRFCDVNCAALPEELLESELFGHAKGAFTGAVADKAGLFEEADGGTLFLDEVPDLSPRGQAKLLRVLQQQEVRRVGETFTRRIDVRLVAAANRDMRAEADTKRFRADLLFRLDVVHIRIPPLRERPEDVPLLAQHFWRAAADRLGSRATLTHAVLAELSRYAWPGNVRELQNVMAALAVEAPERGRVPRSLLPPAVAQAGAAATPKLAVARTQFERRFVEVALARAGGSRTRAAAELGLSRQGLLKTMARLGIGARAADHSSDGTSTPKA